jgi:hypothetical protein
MYSVLRALYFILFHFISTKTYLKHNSYKTLGYNIVCETVVCLPPAIRQPQLSGVRA